MSTAPQTFAKFPAYLFILFLSCIPLKIISQNTDTEQRILLKIKQQLGDPPALQSWTNTTAPCTWPEIDCTGDGRVSQLYLSDKNITVPIPATICDLKNLTYLDLSLNYIPYGFPKVLYKCSTTLEYLDLSQNYFVGPIPDDIDTLSNLKYINVGGNNFSEIPPAIGNLPKLQSLYLNQNEFNGSVTFPKEIGNLAELQVLMLSFNGFAPTRIPVEFGNLSKLTVLRIRNANLIGSIPASFVNLSILVELDLAMNELEGSIPDGLFLLKNLTYLYLFYNKLSGVIPQKVEALNLAEIDFGSNNLNGSISEDFGKLKNLQILHIYGNQLSGELPQSIGLIPTLTSFRVFNNFLSGVLPSEIGLHSKLLYFEVSNNRFSGQLPGNLCAGGVLVGVVAFSNNLTGEVPQLLGNCATLLSVQLYSNSFYGEIPSGIWTAISMGYLMLRDNSFSGQLPSSLGWNMTRLEISNNKFSGPIPSGFSSWVNLVTFEASNNLLSGEIPGELTNLSHLTTLLLDGNQLSGPIPTGISRNLNSLDLSNNKLSGPIPTEISSWVNLTVFRASNNQLSGKIPEELTSLSYLTTMSLDGNQFSGQLPAKIISWKILNTLDLSRNDLSGKIPAALGFLQELHHLDLSQNHLSGKIPSVFCQSNLTLFNLSSNQFSGRIPKKFDYIAYENYFLNNSYLCTLNYVPSLPRCKFRLSSKVVALILAVAIPVFIVTVPLTLFAFRYACRKKQKCEQPMWKMTSFQRVNFTQEDVLVSLTENNLIGSGGSGKVYGVTVNHPGESVSLAVKRIWNNKKIDEKQFVAEVEILGSIRHSNIVKLLCCICSEDSRLLVYEYLENKSLNRWLRWTNRRISLAEPPNSAHNIIVLDWPKRLQIAVGAAQGLCYMHHDCSPPIIHRDVKCSNILLDSEFNARIADFGLAKILAKEGEAQTISSVAGSFGYIAPEYAYTRKVNEKIDVYSFGVVLLELVTGREPNLGNEHYSLAEWAWRQNAEEQHISNFFDEEVKEPCYLEDMTAVFNLGLLCTGKLPNQRPSMKDICQVLRKYSRKYISTGREGE